MTRKRIAALIKQEVQQPTESTNNKSTNNSSAMATTQNIAIADLQLTSQGLFDESKALWNEFIAFDQEHQLAKKVSAQLWRLTKAVGKPALVLSLKGIQTAVVTCRKCRQANGSDRTLQEISDGSSSRRFSGSNRRLAAGVPICPPPLGVLCPWDTAVRGTPLSGGTSQF